MKYIFAAGVPGSRWSRVLSAIASHKNIDNSDKLLTSEYSSTVSSSDNAILRAGSHSGVYFGPGNKFGESFDQLNNITVQEFTDEINRPFSGSGTRIIKSHWFSSYNNLVWLKENFLDEKILIIYNPSPSSLLWWHAVGGWDIPFPDYSWYKDSETMYKEIISNNIDLLRFAKEHQLPLSYDISSELIVKDLGLTSSLSEFDLTGKMFNISQPSWPRLDFIFSKSAMAVFPNDSKMLEQDMVSLFSKSQEIDRGLRSEEIIVSKFGNEYLNNLKNIISRHQSELSLLSSL